MPIPLITFMTGVIAPWVRARLDPRSDRGAALIEYALLVGLIAIVCIAGITILGNRVDGRFSSVGSLMG